MNKQILIAIAITALFTSLMGFYVGRYYEGQTARKRFAQMRQEGFRKFDGQGNGSRMFNRDGQGAVNSGSAPTDKIIIDK